jgi:hypothetical protein
VIELDQDAPATDAAGVASESSSSSSSSSGGDGSIDSSSRRSSGVDVNGGGTPQSWSVQVPLHAKYAQPFAAGLPGLRWLLSGEWVQGLPRR